MVLCMTRDALPVPGEILSHLRTCESCSAQIWVGNSTLVGVAEEYPGMLPRLLCIECGAQRIKESGDEPDFRFPKFQEQYLREHLSDDVVERFKTLFGIT